MNKLLGATKLAGALVLIHLFLVPLVLSVDPVASTFTSWFKDVTFIVSVGFLSGHPLYLLGMLWLSKQRLDDYSVGLVILLSFVSSIVSIYAVAFGLAMIWGLSFGESFAKANGFVVELSSEPLSTQNPLIIFIVPLLSPLILKTMQVVLKARVSADRI